MNHVIKRGVFSMLTSLLFQGTLLASTSPQLLSFQEGEQFTVSLSRLNYNRIFVEGEKIISARFPAGTVIIDKSDMENPNSLEESAYLKPKFDEPITIYFTTDKKHHFSITVNAEESVGKTVRLVARQETFKYVRNTVNNASEVDEAITAMKEGETPKDFMLGRVYFRPFYIKKDIKVTLEKRYENERLTGYVYRLENRGSHPIELSTSFFDKRNAVTLVLSEDTLVPKQVAYLYGLYNHDA